MTLADEQVLENLFQLYLYDLSSCTKFQISENGKFDFDPKIIKAYFTQPHHYPYFIAFSGKIAGFALVRRYPYDAALLDMGQFFVFGSHKRCGVGKAAFQLCLKAYPGQWQIRVLQENLPAKEFWQNTVSEQTGGIYDTVTADYQGKNMLFIRFCI